MKTQIFALFISYLMVMLSFEAVRPGSSGSVGRI